MISYYFKCIRCIFLLLPFLGCTQEGTEFTIEKAATVNYDISDRWNVQGGSTYRVTPATSLDFSRSLAWNSKHIEFTLNSAYEIGFYGKVGGGIMYRFNTIEDPENENEVRFTQQYSLAKNYNAIRIVHRLKLDQRLRTSRDTYRLRYRLSTDFPLNGQSLDLREFYGVISTESIFNTGMAEKPAWDQRFTVGIGNQFLKKLKFQIDIQYRIEDYFITAERRLFIVSQLYYKL